MSARPLILAAALALLLAGPARADDSANLPATPPAGELQPDTILIDGEAVPLPNPTANTQEQTAIDTTIPVPPAAPAGTRNGREIYQRFREGLAEPQCEPGASSRWRQHFAHAPGQLASTRSDILPLFGYVVDKLREAYLPTEFALIPFVESGYRPGARSPQGPAGLWQFIAITARNHNVPIRPGYDGRLSALESTDAAVRYLKTLHGMFAGDWRLAVMAYNAGEYRLLGALKRAGQTPAKADHASLQMPAITQAYVRKLHALSCLLEEAEDHDAWLRSLDRPVPLLAAAEVPTGIGSIDAFASRHGVDATLLGRLNPVFADGRLGKGGRLLAPVGTATTGVATAAPAKPPVATRADATIASSASDDDISDAMADASALVESTIVEPTIPVRTHTVARGDSVWRIARRYGVSSVDLLSRNGLDASSVLKPGMVLAIDPATP